jgi:hypothetical protein
MSELATERGRQRWAKFTLSAGVILPSISILVETTTHICAENFFDPIPTLWHVLLVVFVPLANLQVWLAVRKGGTERGPLLGAANAVAVGVSLFYTIVYLPLLPLALVALIMAGLGLLPMAPVLSLISTLVLRRQLRRIATPQGFTVRASGLAAGVGLALLTVALMELPATVTRVGLRMAASDSPTRRDEGLRWLRSYGNRDFMLRACYERSGRATDLVGYLFSMGDPVSSEEARMIYYRVTGETFNTRLPPTRLRGHWAPQDTFDFDPDQGGEVIAGKVKNLSLAGSRIDGSVDADAGVAYVEWTLVFKNNSAAQQEARAEVQLPPGGVVSRLTLWVNGEEREAAFAGRSQTRQAYQQVVSRRRDPVLVTTAGRDRVLVQCFPVPPGGGEMKIRFGVTAPLAPEDRASGALRLPHFLDRNFRVADEAAHAVWIEAGSPLRAEGGRLLAEHPKAEVYAVRGELKDAELSEPAAVIRAVRSVEVVEAWARDTLVGGDASIVRQFVGEEETATPASIVLVIDTSERVGGSLPEIAAALKTLPPNVEVKLLPAGGNGLYDEAGNQLRSGKPKEVAALSEKIDVGGGADNVAALAKAWDAAAEAPHGAIVWVHGPQPLLLRPVEELRQRWERRPDGTMLYAVQTEVGPDRVSEKLDGIAAVEPIARAGNLQADLENLFARLAGRKKQLRLIRVREGAGHALAVGGKELKETKESKETSAHLARLWANDEVARLLADRGMNRTDEAIELAARYQLVTPVSGAVVLETQQQYQQAGLQPVAPGSVPTIPEPEMVLLIAVAAALLILMFFRRRLAPGSATC